jgi:predicted metal-dependent phosphoesterase TrpH
VHLLAYGVDPDHRGLRAALHDVLAGRNERLPAIVSRLRALGVAVSEDDVRAVSGEAAALGRPHVADALVAAGAVADRTEAFDRYLSPGRPAYVRRRAAPLRAMLGLIAAAGGVGVLAHPWARGSRRVLTPDTVASLAADGLAGLEAWHRDHSADDAVQLQQLASDLGLVTTGSSDYHGTGKVNHELGCHTTAPAQLDALLERMASAAQLARDRDPAVRPAALVAGVAR